MSYFGLSHILDGRDRGVVMAIGELHQFPSDKGRTPTIYAIIKIKKDHKLSVWYDSGKDIIIADDLRVGDACQLVTRDNNCVEWIMVETPEQEVPYQTMTAADVYEERGKSAETLQTEAVAKEFNADSKESVVRRVLRSGSRG